MNRYSSISSFTNPKPKASRRLKHSQKSHRSGSPFKQEEEEKYVELKMKMQAMESYEKIEQPKVEIVTHQRSIGTRKIYSDFLSNPHFFNR